ncbi:hypothetical protein [Bdellovibrio bacteriovorus]|uniref:hypothetical protein n=1 Tax=Bdellovibrio bacteriovorus TaxID=959 RepID=UPI003CFD9C88
MRIFLLTMVALFLSGCLEAQISREDGGSTSSFPVDTANIKDRAITREKLSPEIGVWELSSGNLSFDGNVGVGTSSPQATFEVNGDLKLGTTADICNISKKGSLRYNDSENILEVCNGTLWSDTSPPGTQCGHFGTNHVPCRGYDLTLSQCPPGYAYVDMFGEETTAAGIVMRYSTCMKQ